MHAGGASAGTARSSRPIRWWERMAVTWLGFFLVGTGTSAPQPWGTVLVTVGLMVVVPAVGLVDLAMALWYRWKRSRA